MAFAWFVWLLGCAIQDWRRRQVSNWLTLPPLALAIVLRAFGVIRTPLLPMMVIVDLLLLVWVLGWAGGADLKVSLALAVLDLRLFAWVWLGLVLWYLALRLFFGRDEVKSLPGMVGFFVGASIFILTRLR